VFYNQLKLADLILLNKIDLIKKDEIQLILKEIHHTVSRCRVVPTLRCRIDSETIGVVPSGKDSKLKLGDFTGLNLKEPGAHAKNHLRHDNGSGKSQAHDDKPGDGHNYMAFSFQNHRALDETCFKRFLENLPWELFRLKGPVRFEDRSVLINFVGGKGDWETWRGAPETRLTLTGWDVNEADIIKRLKNCLAEI
jgi:G3E family GTPase